MENQGIGSRYQEETRYDRVRLGGRALDWSEKPSTFKTYPNCIRRLPINDDLDRDGTSLWKTLAKRRSLRKFSRQPLPYPFFARLLWAIQGVTVRDGSYLLRTAPSAGALYPVETYAVINRVQDLSPGIYHLHIADWCLEFIRDGYFGRDLAAAGLDQNMLESAAFVLVWTAVVARSTWKYDQRAYRYIYMDVGHIAQNLYLAAASDGLGCCTVGAFFDGEVNDLIGVDGKEEFALYMGAVGILG